MSFLITAIDASVVEYQHRHRQSVTTNGFNLHSAEPEGAITFDGEHLLSARYGRTDAISHTNAHHTPCTRIQSQARMIHVDDITGIVQGIGTFIHQINILIVLQHIRHDLQGVEVIHRLRRSLQLGLHLLGIHLLHRFDTMHPGIPAMNVERLHLAEHQVKRGSDIPHHRCLNFPVAVHFLRTHIQLDELHFRIPFLTLSVIQQPVESGSYKHHHIGLTQHQTSGCRSTLRMIIRQYPLSHRHRQERDSRLFYKLLQRHFRLCISSTLTDDNQRLGCIRQKLQGTLHSRRRRTQHRSRVHRCEERILGFLHIHRHAEHRCRKVQIDPTWTSRNSRTDSSGHTHRNVLRTVDSIGSLHKRLRHIHLVQPFVITLFQVDDVTVTRTADLNHRETVDRSFCQGSQSVQETRSRYRQANTRLLGQVTADGSCMPC